MTKIRRFFAIAALVATLLGGFSMPAIGTGLTATPLASQHMNAPVSASHAARPVALKIDGPCPLGGELDC